jgi:pimeloyl-ACP methyl ester carboxylesterase
MNNFDFLNINNLLAPQISDDFEKKEGIIKIRMEHENSKNHPPILFVPGSFSGAWIWKGNFLEYFHESGYNVAAMSFRSHGWRGWELWQRGLSEFDRDLKDAISQFDSPPILVAHSLGGLIAQRVALEVPVKALALLSPIPIDGVAPSVFSLAKKSPLSLLKLASITFEPRFSRLAEAPLGIYSEGVRQDIQNEFSGRLQAESPLVLLQSLFHRLDTEKKISCPVHFWGAEGDHIIPASEVERSARALNAPYRIFSGMSHTFQSEPNWKEVASDMLTWVDKI